jgi:large subunit ribosomal protein L29
MKSHEMRGLPREELTGKIGEWEQALFEARCSQAVGQLNNTNELRTLRRDIARAKTILGETEHAPGQ